MTEPHTDNEAAQQRLAADETSLRSASQLKPDTLGSSVSTELANAGFVLAQGVIHDPARQGLLRSTDTELTAGSVLHRMGNPFAARALLWKVPNLTALLESCGLTKLASQLLWQPSISDRRDLF